MEVKKDFGTAQGGKGGVFLKWLIIFDARFRGLKGIDRNSCTLVSFLPSFYFSVNRGVFRNENFR